MALLNIGAETELRACPVYRFPSHLCVIGRRLQEREMQIHKETHLIFIK